MKYTCALLLSLIVSCTTTQRIPLTFEIIDRFNLTAEDLSELQYYISEEIVLSREYENNYGIVYDHKLTLQQHLEAEDIYFRRHVPGRAKHVSKEMNLAIQFENNGDCYLCFGPIGKTGNYQLLCTQDDSCTGSVTYMDEQYTLAYVGHDSEYGSEVPYIFAPWRDLPDDNLLAANPCLLIDVKQLANSRKVRRIVKGAMHAD